MIYLIPWVLIGVVVLLGAIFLPEAPQEKEDWGERPDFAALERSIIQRVSGREPPARITAPDPKGDYITDEETRQRTFEQSADTIGGRVAPWE